MKHMFYTAFFVLVLVALRMLLVNPSWFFLPKSWQRWLFGASYSPFRTR